MINTTISVMDEVIRVQAMPEFMHQDFVRLIGNTRAHKHKLCLKASFHTKQRLLVIISYFLILKTLFMSLFGCFSFWWPIRFLEVICPRYGSDFWCTKWTLMNSLCTKSSLSPFWSCNSIRGGKQPSHECSYQSPIEKPVYSTLTQWLQGLNM